ncbi:MAG TPA: glycosyltransferase family 2 protein [Solirubrobacteraceae bacterium]|jgi:glycosyltransferase involved in cell wall biosynthesis|nr:glycosyltransferase family 2 protein [Solirubrobacteraceae bacterium]
MTARAISVVVATRDRPAALERCLTALTWQTERSLEIVVVDDASTDPAAVGAIVASVLGAADPRLAALVVRGPGRGPATARNLGAQVASGTVVCFTDDDCVALPRWARRLAAACAPGAAAAGITIADPEAGRAAGASQLLTHTLQLASLDPATGNLGFAPTCNLACHAEVLRRLPFDESFALAAGEDRDWCARLASAGVALRFVPEALVEHRPQMGLSGLVRQQLRYGRGAVRFRGAGDGRRLSGAAFYRRLAREALAAGPVSAAFVGVAQGAVATGALLELLAPGRQ